MGPTASLATAVVKRQIPALANIILSVLSQITMIFLMFQLTWCSKSRSVQDAA
jgi:hypothetical protein